MAENRLRYRMSTTKLSNHDTVRITFVLLNVKNMKSRRSSASFPTCRNLMNTWNCTGSIAWEVTGCWISTISHAQTWRNAAGAGTSRSRRLQATICLEAAMRQGSAFKEFGCGRGRAS
jgi:hypothetical protein